MVSIPKIQMKLIKKNRDGAKSIHLRDFEFEKKTTEPTINQAIAVLDHKPFDDKNERAWLLSNEAYYNSLPDAQKDDGKGIEVYMKRWIQYGDTNSGTEFTKQDATLIVDAWDLDKLANLNIRDKNGTFHHVVKDGTVQGDWSSASSSGYVYFSYDGSTSKYIIFNATENNEPVTTARLNVIIKEGGYPYEIFVETGLTITAGSSRNYLMPGDSTLIDPDNFDIGYAYKSTSDDLQHTRYWQVGVKRGDVPSDIAHSKYYLGNDNSIYMNSIPDDKRIYPTKTAIHTSDKLYAAQQNAVRALVNSRFNENITIEVNDLTDPIDLSKIELFDWFKVYDSSNQSKLMPVSEIENDNGEIKIKLGFKKTLLTEIIKG